MTGEPVENRWLPPSPHRERVLELIAKGRAHLEEQGHGQPPLLVYEDGGVLELPRVRIGFNDIVAESRPEAPTRLTRHCDVCGCVDEIEAWLRESPEGLQADPERLGVLLDDALYMAARMERRLGVYREFAAHVAKVAAAMAAIAGPEVSHLAEEAEAVRRRAAAGEAPTDEGAAEIVARAEAVRDVANGLEQALYRYREAAIELAALYEVVRGARNWEQGVRKQLAARRGGSESSAAEDRD